MRRPPPIPTSPAAPARADAESSEHADPSDLDARASGTPADAPFEVSSVLPVSLGGRPTPLPLRRDDERRDDERRDDDPRAVRPPDPDEPDTEPAPDAAPGDGIGIRDVWAAARARRKALRAEVRRFTARQRRRRMVWIGVVSALALLVLGSLGAAYSPLFAVERVRVIGASTLDAAAIEQALSGQLGTPLPRVDSSAVKAALVQFPLVESYTLEARPPHELVVRVVERTPIGVIESDAGFTMVDAAGVALATTPQAPPGQPVITAEGGVGSPAFAAIGTVFRSLPQDIRTQITAMSATTANDVMLTLGATGTEVVWGNADDSPEKARVLASIMAARPPDGVSRYDVSAPDAAVIR